MNSLNIEPTIVGLLLKGHTKGPLIYRNGHMVVADRRHGPYSFPGSTWGPKDHIDIRIPRSGSKAQHKGDTKNRGL